MNILRILRLLTDSCIANDSMLLNFPSHSANNIQQSCHHSQEDSVEVCNGSIPSNKGYLEYKEV